MGGAMDGVRTLGSWEKRLLPVPNTLECAEMRLLSATDSEDPVFVGTGQIKITSFMSMDFTMSAQASNGNEAFRRLVRAQDNPYDVREQFRLEAVDYDGNEWACGWTGVRLVSAVKDRWLLTGKLRSLVTSVSGQWVSKVSGVELVFLPRLHLPMEHWMESVTKIGGEEIQYQREPGRCVLRVLGSEIEFYHRPGSEALYLAATASTELPHPYLENWLSEPLRVLTGQLIYPRLVARNKGNGTADVWLRPSPSRLPNAGLASLLGKDPIEAKDSFWEMYSGLLAFIANARDADNQPNFESNRLTRFYEEIAQAAGGSRWVLCLTLASTAEGIAKMIMRPEEQKSDFDSAQLACLKRTVKKWEGDPELKKRILGDISRAGIRTIGSFLKSLVNRQVVGVAQAQAWKDVRNQVMHGNLISPWGGKDEDQRLMDLTGLVHSLTNHLLERTRTAPEV